MSKKRKNKLRVKKMNPGVYVAACMLIASALMMALIIGLAEWGFVNIRTINLVIETETAVKVYDGEPLTGKTYKILYGSLAPGHYIYPMSYKSQTEVGECVNHIEFMIYDTSGSDVTELYNIDQRSGKLTVVLREVTLRVRSASKVYDGKPLSNSGIDVIGPQKFAPGHTAYIYATPEITNVGEVANNGMIKVLTEDGLDVTSQYMLNVDEGKLRVDPKQITVKLESATKIYDGTPLVNNNWSLTSGSLLEGHRLDVKCTGSLTEVGEIPNEAIINIYDSEGIDVTPQYKVNVNSGKLTVTSRSLYITTGSAEKVYDSTVLKADNWKITSGTLDKGDKLEVAGYTELSEVGTVQNQLTFVVRDESGRDVTSRYNIIQSMGWLKVSPRKISISTGTAQKKYDGTPLYSDKWRLISGSLCAGHSLSIVSTRRTAVGVSENILISFAIYQERNGVRTEVTDCYQITFSYGTLTVKP